MRKNRFVVSIIVMMEFLSLKPSRGVCIYPYVICKDTMVSYNLQNGGSVFFTCNVPLSYFGPIIQFSLNPSVQYKVQVFGRFVDPKPCSFQFDTVIACDSFTQSTVLLISTPLNGSGVGENYYFLATPTNTSGQISVSYLVTPSPCEIYPTEIPCENCIPSFAPQPDSTYAISAWVKEGSFSPSTTTYSNAYIDISYDTGPTTSPFKGKGQIIDGWQRIEESFTIPHSATQINLNLHCGSSTAYFDDVRVFPAKGIMKSYVFDPLSLCLVAELDERNYATIYEYDEEGKLTRVKKETERGIMTIQETKTNTSK